MGSRHVVWCCGAALWLGACGEGAEIAAPDATQAAGYRQIHEKIITPSCALPSCHAAPVSGGLDLVDVDSSYAALVDVAPSNFQAAQKGMVRVKPGDPDASFLFQKVFSSSPELAAEALGAAMPLGAVEALGPRSLSAVRSWILAGAPMEGIDFEADSASRNEENAYVVCDAEEAGAMRDCFRDRPEGHIQRWYTPPLIIPPGEEVLICNSLAEPTDRELLVRNVFGQQFAGGHHVALYTRPAPSDNHEPHVCTEEDMQNLRLVAGADITYGDIKIIPDGSALRIPEGSQIVIQSHYINITTEPMVVMDVVDAEFYGEGEEVVLADTFVVMDSDFEIPPGAMDFERTKECTVDEEMEIHVLLGHTHEFGVLFTAEFLPVDGDPMLIYHATDGALLRDNPDLVKPDEGHSLVARPGDRIRITCRWDNITDGVLDWPAEMCLALMIYTPSRGFLICDTGDETPEALGASDDPEVMGCVDPGEEGNALGVGRFCTAEGRECMGLEANFCLAAFDPTSNYCSIILCDVDEECGEGASCVHESAGSACVPTICQ